MTVAPFATSAVTVTDPRDGTAAVAARDTSGAAVGTGGVSSAYGGTYSRTYGTATAGSVPAVSDPATSAPGVSGR